MFPTPSLNRDVLFNPNDLIAQSFNQDAKFVGASPQAIVGPGSLPHGQPHSCLGHHACDSKIPVATLYIIVGTHCCTITSLDCISAKTTYVM